MLGGKMKKLNVGVCILDDNDVVLSKRMIESELTNEVKKGFIEDLGINAFNAICDLVKGELKIGLDADILKGMLKEIEFKENGK
jgi:hypothetical protein